MQVRSIQSHRLNSIDAMRGLAALAVVFLHLRHDAPGGFRINPLFFPFLAIDFGYLGVTLFIVLSGFCIHLAVARGMGQGKGIHVRWGPFWKRRFWRLYPPYVAALVLSLIVVSLIPAASPGEELSWSRETLVNLATHLTMCHNLFQNYACSLGNSPFWSLGMEEQLYALYAVYLFLICRGMRRTAIALPLAVAVLWRLGQCTFLQGAEGDGLFGLGTWDAWPFGHWFAWILGALAAECYMGTISLPRWCHRVSVGLVALLLGVILNKTTLALVVKSSLFGSRLGLDSQDEATRFLTGLANEAGELTFELAFFILVNGWVRADALDRFEGPMTRWLARLGLISYSLYLTHLPIIRLLDLAFPMDAGIGSAVVRYGVFAPVCVLVAALFFLTVERRFLRRPAPQGHGQTLKPVGSNSAAEALAESTGTKIVS
jgi:peptidoglycan/LPS O-acetylase OafA/YrhL